MCVHLYTYIYVWGYSLLSVVLQFVCSHTYIWLPQLGCKLQEGKAVWSAP